MSDEIKTPGLRPMRPRLAASILLTRARPNGLEVLMGRRAAHHVFMPQKYVFPGGRVDRADATAPLAGDIPPVELETMCRILPERRARAAAVAAVRELAEETGLLIGRKCENRSRHPHWAPFKQAGAAPDISALSLIARAVTPPGRTRRFDTWFFAAPESALLDDRPAQPSDELEDVRWVTLDEARALDLPIITHVVIEELRRVTPPAPERPRSFRQMHGRMRADPL